MSAEAPVVWPNGSLGAKVNTLATVTDVENYFCRLFRQGRFRRFARPQTEFLYYYGGVGFGAVLFYGKIFEEHRKI
mgnify:FL=1